MKRGRFEHPNMASIHQFGVKATGCPFCTSQNLALSVTAQPHVSCLGCGADGPQISKGDDPREAVHLWNIRPQNSAGE